MLLFQPDGALVTGRVLFGDAASGEPGAVTLVAFEKAAFSLMFARLAEQVSGFVEREEKIGVTIRRTDLSQPALRLDDETIFLLHADPVTVIRGLQPSPAKVFVRRADPASLSPLRIGFDALAATFGDEVFIRRRGDQVECPCCGRWTDVRTAPEANRPSLSVCRSRACDITLPIVLRGDRWASLTVSSLLAAPGRERFFFPREWNKSGPWITRKDLEVSHRDWTTIKQEFA